MLRFAQFVVAILIVTAPVLATDTGGDKKKSMSMSRHDFARALGKLKEGTSEKEVLALLGKPDDIKTKYDAGGITTSRTREIWRYGTDGHLTFPTLGCVYIDPAGKVQYVYGGKDQPPAAETFTEPQLRALLRLIDKAPSYNSSYAFDPRQLIEIVNVLQPLGKEKALAAIDEYLRVSSGFHGEGRDGVFLVLRVLFDVPVDVGHMPSIGVGGPWPDPAEDEKRLPRFPILLHQDVPFLLVHGYTLAGVAEQPESHVSYFREKGQLRKTKLTPGNAPAKLVTSVLEKVGKLYAKDENFGKTLIANQVLNMVDSVHRRERNWHGWRFDPGQNVSAAWKPIEAEIAKLDVRWNRDKNRFVFADGSHLPEPERKLYRRHIWQVDGLKGEASLTLERVTDKDIVVLLACSGNQDMPAFKLTMFAGKDKTKSLAQWDIPAETRAGESVYSSRMYRVELREGMDIQAGLKIEGREQFSPVYVP